MSDAKQPSLFDLEEPIEPSQLETAIEDVGDRLDHWQAVLPEDEWQLLRETVDKLFRFTSPAKETP